MNFLAAVKTILCIFQFLPINSNNLFTLKNISHRDTASQFCHSVIIICCTCERKFINSFFLYQINSIQSSSTDVSKNLLSQNFIDVISCSSSMLLSSFPFVLFLRYMRKRIFTLTKSMQ
jgi:hypothetical protein